MTRIVALGPLGICLLTVSCFLGCQAHQEPAPLVALPESFVASGSVEVAPHWWESFDDPALDDLVRRGLDDNFDLLAAWDRLAQAEAVARRERAGLFPTLDAETSLTRTELTQSAARGSGAGGRNDIRLGVAAAYELDLWGRLRSQRDAARLDAEARAQDVRVAAISLSAEIATTWYELVEQRRQLAVIDEQIRTNERVLDLLSWRYRSGLVQASDVLRQRQLLEATRAEKPTVAGRARVLEHLLATLLGKAPGQIDIPTQEEFPALPPLPAAGLPADVVGERPDVEAAYLAVLAADEQLDVARADRYPRLTVNGGAAFAAEDVRDLFDNWIATFAANLVAPILDGGRRRAEVARVRALVSERARAYGQAVLTALREVDDALVREKAQRARIALLENQLRISNAVVERIRDQYLFGASEYLDVLDALSSNQSLQRSLQTARRELFAIRVELHRALAGGFPLDRPELQEVPVRVSEGES